MSFQFLSYQQLKENFHQLRQEWIEEYKLNSKKLSKDQQRQLLKINELHTFIMQLDAWNLSNIEVQKKDTHKDSLLLDASAMDALRAKVLTAKLTHLRKQIEIKQAKCNSKVEKDEIPLPHEVPDVEDRLFANSIQFLIGENTKNPFTVDAEKEAEEAWKRFEPLSLAKIRENIRKLRMAEIAKYNKVGEFNFEKVPEDRKKQLNAIEAVCNDLAKNKTIPEVEKVQILIGKLLLVRNEIEESYKKRMLSAITSFFTSPESSALYMGIYPAIGITGKEIDPGFAREAIISYDRYNKGLHTDLGKLNDTVLALDLDTEEPKLTLKSEKPTAHNGTMIKPINAARIYTTIALNKQHQFGSDGVGGDYDADKTVRADLEARSFPVRPRVRDGKTVQTQGEVDVYAEIKELSSQVTVKTFAPDMLAKQKTPVDRHARLHQGGDITDVSHFRSATENQQRRQHQQMDKEFHEKLNGGGFNLKAQQTREYGLFQYQARQAVQGEVLKHRKKHKGDEQLDSSMEYTSPSTPRLGKG